MPRKVQAALIAGSMYEPLYDLLEDFSVTRDVRVAIEYRDDHPALNAHLASSTDLLYDLISTHRKYAPSQAHFLAPLQTHIQVEEPEIETVLWRTVQRAIVGELTVDAALRYIVSQITDIIEAQPQGHSKFSGSDNLTFGERS